MTPPHDASGRSAPRGSGAAGTPAPAGGFRCPECRTKLLSPNYTICPACACPLDPTQVRAAFPKTSGSGSDGSARPLAVWLVLGLALAAVLVALLSRG